MTRQTHTPSPSVSGESSTAEMLKEHEALLPEGSYSTALILVVEPFFARLQSSCTGTLAGWITPHASEAVMISHRLMDCHTLEGWRGEGWR